MKKLLGISVLALALAAPAGLVAQEKDEKETFIYATYFHCQSSKFDDLDAAVTEHTAPVYNAAMKDGTIGGWGWLAHHTGGHWNRLFYTVSDSVPNLLAAQKTMADRSKDLPDGGMSEACGAHDDYIWQSENNSGMMDKRGTAALSVYYECDISREEDADKLVDELFAPLYNKAIKEGKITSWGWSSHMVGGKYRKLGTMTGESFEKVLAARGEILEALWADGENSEANEFSKICGSHADYLWQILNEGRP